MTPGAFLKELRDRGVELRLSDDLRHILCRGATDDDRRRIDELKLWLLMLLAHEEGGDAYDPRLAFLAHAEGGLTDGAIGTCMEIAFSIKRDIADVFINPAIEHGYLLRRGEILFPAGEVAAMLSEHESHKTRQ